MDPESKNHNEVEPKSNLVRSPGPSELAGQSIPEKQSKAIRILI